MRSELITITFYERSGKDWAYTITYFHYVFVVDKLAKQLNIYMYVQLRIRFTYQFSIFHFREIFMFYYPSGFFSYCPIIRIDFCVISWKNIFFPKFY